MARLNLLTGLLCLLSLTTGTAARRYTKAADAILLSDIHALTFKDGAQTSGRRLSPIPQLKCAGSGCAHFTPASVRCTNAGSSYSSADVEWTCAAALPPEVRLGATDVVCEGFDSAHDDYVLKGSCGLEYRPLLTDYGADKFGASASWGSSVKGSSLGEGFAAALFWLLFAGVAFVILRGLVAGLRQNGVRRGPGGTGWGFGGGGDGDDPPPPYDPRPPRYTSKPRTATSSNAGWFGGGGRQQAQGWRPGFWTGAATGAAAGYFAGNRANTGTRQQRYDPGEGSSFRPFAGGGRRSGQSSSSVSSERYESTGFGGTRRR